MKQLRVLVIAVACVGCAGPQLESQSEPYAAVQTRHHLGEGDTGKPPLDAAPKATPPSAAPELKTGFLPDPEPLVEKHQFEYVIRHVSGELSVVSIAEKTHARPRATARRMGRFAFELWIGRELIDRVRFDFPLLAAEPAPSESSAPNLSQGADVEASILVPRSDRATRAQIVDRATGKVTVLPWPPIADGESHAFDHGSPEKQ
jgi:hypothetical protein